MTDNVSRRRWRLHRTCHPNLLSDDRSDRVPTSLVTTQPFDYRTIQVAQLSRLLRLKLLSTLPTRNEHLRFGASTYGLQILERTFRHCSLRGNCWYRDCQSSPSRTSDRTRVDSVDLVLAPQWIGAGHISTVVALSHHRMVTLTAALEIRRARSQRWRDFKP